MVRGGPNDDGRMIGDWGRVGCLYEWRSGCNIYVVSGPQFTKQISQRYEYNEQGFSRAK